MEWSTDEWEAMVDVELISDSGTSLSSELGGGGDDDGDKPNKRRSLVLFVLLNFCGVIANDSCYRISDVIIRF